MVTNAPSSSIWYVSEPLLGTQANAADDDTISWERIDNAVQCEDDSTVVFTLPKPEPAFMERLTFAAEGIVDSAHAIALGEWDGTAETWQDWIGRDLAASALSDDPSGTGAYRIVSADASDISLTAFEDYWGEQPAIQNVVRRLVTEESSRLQALLSGDADIIETGGREVIETQLAGQQGVQIVDGIPSYLAVALHMNQDTTGSQNIGSGELGADGVPTDFFADKDMRLCFTKAFGYDEFSQALYGENGEPRNVLLPSRFPGYDPSIAPPTLDLEAAEEHCRAAHGGQAWEQGFSLNAGYREGSGMSQTALEILKQNIEALNPKFKVNLVGKQWSDLISPSNIEVLQVGGWLAGFAESDNFFRTFYHPGGLYADINHIDDTELNGYIDEARYEADDTRRQELYSKAAQRALDEGLYVVLPVELGISAYSAALQGVQVEDYNPLAGYFYKDLRK